MEMNQMGPEIAFMNAVELGSRIRRRDLSPVEVVNFFLDRINERNETKRNNKMK